MATSKEKYGINARRWAMENFTEESIANKVKIFFGENN